VLAVGSTLRIGIEANGTIDAALSQSVDELIHYFARHWLEGTTPEPGKVIEFVRQLTEPKLLAEIARLRAELEFFRRYQTLLGEEYD
jgi:hypothetical protein